MKVMKRSRKSEETLISCMDEMRQKHSDILSHAMCARNECGSRDRTRTKKTATLRARSRVHVVLHVDVSLDLGFHVVIGVGRLIVQRDGFIRQLHFTTHTQYQVQSSFFWML